MGDGTRWRARKGKRGRWGPLAAAMWWGLPPMVKPACREGVEVRWVRHDKGGGGGVRLWFWSWESGMSRTMGGGSVISVATLSVRDRLERMLWSAPARTATVCCCSLGVLPYTAVPGTSMRELYSAVRKTYGQ